MGLADAPGPQPNQHKGVMYMGYVLMQDEQLDSWFQNDRRKPVIGVRDDLQGHWWAKFVKSPATGHWYLYTLVSGADTIVTFGGEGWVGTPVASRKLIAVLEDGERRLRERTDFTRDDRLKSVESLLEKAQRTLDEIRQSVGKA